MTYKGTSQLLDWVGLGADEVREKSAWNKFWLRSDSPSPPYPSPPLRQSPNMYRFVSHIASLIKKGPLLSLEYVYPFVIQYLPFLLTRLFDSKIRWFHVLFKFFGEERMSIGIQKALQNITKHYKTLQNININSISSSATARHFFGEGILYQKIALPNIFKIVPWEHLKLSYNSYRKGFFLQVPVWAPNPLKIGQQGNCCSSASISATKFPKVLFKVNRQSFFVLF